MAQARLPVAVWETSPRFSPLFSGRTERVMEIEPMDGPVGYFQFVQRMLSFYLGFAPFMRKDDLSLYTEGLHQC